MLKINPALGLTASPASIEGSVTQHALLAATAEGFTWVPTTQAPEPQFETSGSGGDTVAGDTSTTATLDLGETVDGFVNTAGDKDWYAIELTAGDFYQFGLRGVGGTGALADPILQLRDSSGAVIAVDDDGGEGRNSLLQFTVEESGTYYLAAGGYQSNKGGYRLSANEVPAPDILDSIDWGTKVNTTTVKVYFAKAGETYDGEKSLGWNPYEIKQAMLAFQQYSDIINVEFVQTTNAADATFKLVTNKASDYLGYFNPPGEKNPGVGVFSRTGDGWNEEGGGGLEKGGYGFITMIHEFGHGMGLAHPHDDGGTSSVMLGVDGPFDSYGLYNLNQGVFTTMSYNDAWATGPNGLSKSNSYGWQGTMMALDVAILQEKYGANTSFHGGSDTYQLADANAAGTMYACIWDTGGKDTLSYGGSRAATLDLRAATIDYSSTGGGVVSWVNGIVGGYTIAQGVKIENASGGSGADRITGNGAANKLKGNAGADTIEGGGGSDKLTGGAGADTFVYSAVNGGKDTITDLTGDDIIKLKDIDADVTRAGDQAFTLVDAFGGHAGEARFFYDSGSDRTVLQLDVDGDSDADMRILITGDHSGFDNFVL